MSLPPGTRLGPHEILSPLGAGGMGEVYRARDTRLDRDVAIKVLPAAVAQDAERLARFEREAKVLASLNHPHIAQIYGVEESDGVRALVMELVPGETLAAPLPLEIALQYARQIADALEAAHDKGITHRDLKPANIMITPAGSVKLLDFGLAAAPQPSSGSPHTVNSPTLTIGATQAGVIMGTAGYMSPEQAVGKPVDRRADIWSFGVVLFEMLSGKPLFDGETVSHVLADVIRAEIDLSRLPGSTPAAIRELIRRCLDRDVKNRLRDIGEARIAIERYLANPVSASAALPTVVARPARLSWIIAAAAVLVAGALGYVAVRHQQEEPPHPVWLSFLPPGGSFKVDGTSGQPTLAVSPDGRHIAFEATTDGKQALWLRDLDSRTARMLPDTDQGRFPFWSVDSRFVGFYQSGKVKKLGLSGGPVVTICEVTGYLGASWAANDVILLSTGSGLARVSAGGGPLTRVIEPNPALGEDSLRYPWFLPDGHHFLVTSRNGERTRSSIRIGDLSSDTVKPLIEAASNVVYVAPGYLLFVRNRTVMAQPFDAAKLQLNGSPIPVAEHVAFNVNNVFGNFTASLNGVLAYMESDASSEQIMRFDRTGKRLGTIGPPGGIEMFKLSPDDTMLVASRIDTQSGNTDLWLHDLVRDTASRFTFTGSNRYPIWSPDGRYIVFNSAREGVRKIYRKLANGTGQDEILADIDQLPNDWSRDGRYLIGGSGVTTPKTGNDLWVYPQFGDRKPIPYIQTEFFEFYGRLSPDGRWLTYTSNESNQFEIYVVSFPTPGGKWKVSTAGGTRPVWARDGREIYFQSYDGKLMVAEVKPGATFQAGIPKPLFEVHMPGGNTGFDITRNGQFIIPTLLEQGISSVMVVTNWPSLLKK